MTPAMREAIQLVLDVGTRGDCLFCTEQNKQRHTYPMIAHTANCELELLRIRFERECRERG